jgi:hypothetical protein
MALHRKGSCSKVEKCNNPSFVTFSFAAVNLKKVFAQNKLDRLSLLTAFLPQDKDICYSTWVGLQAQN